MKSAKVMARSIISIIFGNKNTFGISDKKKRNQIDQQED